MIKKFFYIPFLLLLTLSACESEKLDENAAQQRVEKLMKDISNNKFDGIGKHFTDQFNQNEPVDKKIEKYQQLKRVLGNLTSMEVISSSPEANFGEQSKVLLQYRISYENATTLEDFTVVKDEGEYRIASHHIKNE
ncbi:MAG: hypothetical protein ACR2GN_10170 [Bacteroidia bacterium]